MSQMRPREPCGCSLLPGLRHGSGGTKPVDGTCVAAADATSWGFSNSSGPTLHLSA